MMVLGWVIAVIGGGALIWYHVELYLQTRPVERTARAGDADGEHTRCGRIRNGGER